MLASKGIFTPEFNIACGFFIKKDARKRSFRFVADKSYANYYNISFDTFQGGKQNFPQKNFRRSIVGVIYARIRRIAARLRRGRTRRRTAERRRTGCGARSRTKRIEIDGRSTRIAAFYVYEYRVAADLYDIALLDTHFTAVEQTEKAPAALRGDYYRDKFALRKGYFEIDNMPETRSVGDVYHFPLF